jgi:ribosomal protein S12 methylthiotransferase
MFSPEEGTPAADMPDQVPDEIKQERYDRLMSLQQKISLERNQARVGSVEQVLVTDAGGKGFCLGRSMREAPEIDGEMIVEYGQTPPEAGQFIPVRITEASAYDLRGKML